MCSMNAHMCIHRHVLISVCTTAFRLYSWVYFYLIYMQLYSLHTPKHAVVHTDIHRGIQIQKSKIYFNEVALRIGCRNMFWSQCFNQNLGPAIVVLAALDTRAASTTTAGAKVVQPVQLIKFWLKHCDQGIFLHPILSATLFN